MYPGALVRATRGGWQPHFHLTTSVGSWNGIMWLLLSKVRIQRSLLERMVLKFEGSRLWGRG